MSTRSRFVSARMQEEQRNHLIKFTSTMKLIKLKKRISKKKGVLYPQFLGTYGVIDHTNENLRALGLVNYPVEKKIADEEWRCINLKRNRSIFDEGCGAPPKKKMRVEVPCVEVPCVEVPQLTCKRKREEEDLLMDAPPAKKRRMVDPVAQKPKLQPLVLLPSISEPPEHGLDDTGHVSSEILKHFIVLFLIMLEVFMIWQLNLLIGGSTSF